MVKIIEGYVLNEVIGQGNFGLVYRATHKQKNGVFAVKVIPIQKFQENQKLEIYTNNQIQALQAIGISDYIIRFYEIIKSKHNRYLVYQYCNGGTLLSMLKKQHRLEQKKALLIFKQLLQAFKILNKNSIMHRDLKPENIFFTSLNENQEEIDLNNDKKKVKLGDFGFCKGLKPDQKFLAKSMLGSPIYMAPQVLKGEAYNAKADIWSLGVILFEMLYAYCPYESNSIANLISTIDTKQVQLPAKIPVTQKTQILIKKMLTKDYFRRIGWVELFNVKIDENGEYIQQQINVNKQQRGSTPNKKVFTSLFGSLSIGAVQPLIPNNRSYSTTVRDEQAEQKNEGKNDPSKYIMSKKSIEESTPMQLQQNEARGNSQPKEQKKFYSQNYLSILTTPLSLKKIQNENNNNSKSREETKVGGSFEREKYSQYEKPLTNTIPTSPPMAYRQQRLTSIDNIQAVKDQSTQLNSHLPNLEPTPFNKYRQNIGMGSNLSSRFMSDRNIKDAPRHSNNIFVGPSVSNGSGLEIDAKRLNLLKNHEGITKTLSKTMQLFEQKFLVFKSSKQISDFGVVKDLLQDCYLVLKVAQQKLKLITQSIKITETSLLDMATIVNYEHIQVEKFIIQLRNQLLRYSVQLPNVPSGAQLSKNDRMENVINFKELIKNKQMTQIIDDCF